MTEGIRIKLTIIAYEIDSSFQKEIEDVIIGKIGTLLEEVYGSSPFIKVEND